MTQPPPYTLTNQSITVVWEGKPHVVQKGAPQFNALRKAIIEEDWDAVPKNLTVAKSIKDWAKGKFTMEGNNFLYDGAQLPSDINERIVKMATSGEDPSPLFKFWERLQKNPSMRSVEQLWPFLAHKGIPLTKDGHFLAYKGVRMDYMDAHSGTISNKPGTHHVMPRNQISDDPNHACHEGFHVGALAYAGSFSSRVVICEVDPEHVVCVPYDESQHKMRVCEYRVIGNHNGSSMSSTTHEEETPKEVKTVPDPKPAKEKTGKQKKAEHKAKKKAGKVLVRGFEKLGKMDMAALLQESLDSLRTYAGKGLKIVGASKVPGGKTALVSLILQTRG